MSYSVERRVDARASPAILNLPVPVTSLAKADPLDTLAFSLLVLGAATTPAGIVRVAGFALCDVFFTAAAALFLISGSRKPRLNPPMQIAAWLALIATLLASTAASDTADSLLAGLRLVYVLTIWQWGMRGLIASRTRLEIVVIAFGIGAALSGIVGVLQLATGLYVEGSTVVFGRSSGLQGHPNGQGGILAVSAAVGFGLVTNRAYRAVGAAILACSLFGLIASGSVSGMLGAAAGVCAVLLVIGLSTKALIALGGVAVAAVFVTLNLESIVPGATSPLTRFTESTGGGEGVSTLGLRVQTIEYAIAQIMQHPFVGVGLNAESGGTYDGVTQAHNMWVLVWLQGGLIMLVAVTMILVAIVPRAWRLAKGGGHTASIAAVAAAAAALVVAASGPVLFDRWFWLPILLCACVIELSKGSDRALPAKVS